MLEAGERRKDPDAETEKAEMGNDMSLQIGNMSAA